MLKPVSQPVLIDSSSFSRTIGKRLDEARYEDRTIIITRHGRPSAVLMSIREYDRLLNLLHRIDAVETTEDAMQEVQRPLDTLMHETVDGGSRHEGVQEEEHDESS